MSQQQNVIQKFMHSLDETKQHGTAALDEAVRACSQFRSYQDLVNHFISDAEQAGSYQSFLRNSCGIILDNDDTGAITGADAGGSSVKTAESIVPEPKGTVRWEYHTDPKTGEIYHDIRGLRFVVAKNRAVYDSYTEKETIIRKGLSAWWISGGLDLINESYGMSFGEQGTTAKKVELLFEDNPSSNKLAWVTPWTRNGKVTKLTLTVNLAYYQDIRGGDSNGKGADNAGYLDRTIAHELTHAVMAANIDCFNKLPDLIIEGMAELTHGIDDRRTSDIRRLAQDPGTFQYLSTASEKATGDVYAGGYMLLRYLAKQGASYTGGSTTGGGTSGTTVEYLSDGTQHTHAPGLDLFVGARTPSTIRAGSDPAAMWGGGAASDTFVAGTAKDYFWIGAGDGSDRVQGFKKGTDTVYCWSGRPALMLTSRGSDLIVSPDGGSSSLTLTGAMASDQGEIGILAFGESQESAVVAGRINMGQGGYNDVISATDYHGTTLLLGGTTSSILAAGHGTCAMWGGGSASDCLMGSATDATYFWFGRGDGEDYAYSSSGKDTVFLWNVSDIRAIHVTRDAEAESLLRQAGGADAQYTQVTVGSDTLTVSSTGGRPDLMLASGATYRVTERGSGVSLTRIR